MNWEIFAALAEVVGAIGVVVTLLYVARQIRAASVEGQRTRYNELTSSIASTAQAWAASDTLSEIMFRGLRDAASLQPNESFRFYSSIFGLMKTWETTYHYSIDRGIHDWGADGLRATMSSFMALPGMQKYWAERRSWYSQDFQAEVDRVIGLGAERMDDAYKR